MIFVLFYRIIAVKMPFSIMIHSGEMSILLNWKLVYI